MPNPANPVSSALAAAKTRAVTWSRPTCTPITPGPASAGRHPGTRLDGHVPDHRASPGPSHRARRRALGAGGPDVVHEDACGRAFAPTRVVGGCRMAKPVVLAGQGLHGSLRHVWHLDTGLGDQQREVVRLGEQEVHPGGTGVEPVSLHRRPERGRASEADFRDPRPGASGLPARAGEGFR